MERRKSVVYANSQIGLTYLSNLCYTIYELKNRQKLLT